MYRTKMTVKGQVTIPKAVRDKIGLNPGDTLEIRETQGVYTLQKFVDSRVLQKYVGIANSPSKNTDALITELRGDNDSSC